MSKNPIVDISGSGGGKAASGSSGSATEQPNNLKCTALAQMVHVLGEGSIGGLVKGAESIFIDDTALLNSDGNYNFEGVAWWERTGDHDQDPIPFDDVEAEVTVGIAVTQDIGPVTRTIASGDFDDIRITLSCSQFEKMNKSDGSIVGSEVNLNIYVKPYGGSFILATQVNIKGKTNQAYQRSILIDNFKTLYGDGPWDIKIERVTADPSGSNVSNEITWASYATVLNTRFTMPDIAAIGIAIDAKQFGSKVPTFSFDVYGMDEISIPSNYDPATRAYTGVWDGTFVLGWTDNPAWIFYDLCTNARYGLGRKITADRIDKWVLYTIAQYCDDLVDDGHGGTEPRFVCTLYIQTQEEALHVLNALASTFLSMPLWSAGWVTLAQDAPKDPSHLAVPANVIDGQFNYSGTGLSARCSSVLVTWNDPNDSCKAAIEVVEDAELILKYGWIKKDVLAVGCYRRSQARRLGKWMLDSEKSQPETLAFTGGWEFADCVPGNIIDVADPAYAGVRYGGRVSGGFTAPQNMLTWSNRFDVSPWSRGGASIVSNNDDGPFAANDPFSDKADKLVESSNNEAHGVVQTITKSACSLDYATTFHVKPNGRTQFAVWLSDANGSDHVQALFDLTTCKFVSWSSSGTSILPGAFQIVPSNQGYFRVTAAANVGAGVTSLTVAGLLAESGATTYIGNGTSGAYLWNGQIEQRNYFTRPVLTSSVPHSVVPTTTWVPLDAPVDIQTGESYTLSCVMPEKTISEKTVSSPAGKQSGLTLSAALDFAPEPGAIWILSASNCTPRQFRCLSNKPTKDGGFEIQALFHDPLKYARVYEGLDLELPPSSLLTTGPLATPSVLTVQTFSYQDGRNFSMGVLLSWPHTTDERVTGYVIEMLPPDGGWQELGRTDEPSFEYKGIAPGTYSFRVKSTGPTSGAYVEADVVVIIDPNTAPEIVNNIALKGGGTTFNGVNVEIVWDRVWGSDYLPEFRFKDYKVEILDSTGATLLRTEYVRDESYVYTFEKNIKDSAGSARASFMVLISARDIYDASGTAGEVVFTNATPSMVAITPTATVSPTGFILDWSTYAPTDTDLDGFDIRVDTVNPPVVVALHADASARKTFVPVNTVTVPASYYVSVVPRDKFAGGRAGTASVVITATVTTAIDNSQVVVGGRNILPNSDTLSSAELPTGGSITTGIAGAPDGTATAIRLTSPSVSGLVRWSSLMNQGGALTFGAWLKTETGTLAISTDVNDGYGLGYNLTTTWQFLPGIMNVTPTGSPLWFDIRWPANKSFLIWHPKLEYGNTATNWTPAPEDLVALSSAAQAAADSAMNDITDMAADGKLTPAEKRKADSDWDYIVAEANPTDGKLYVMAGEMGISRTALVSAYNALYDVLFVSPGVLSNLTTTTTLNAGTITRTAFKAVWKAYYAAASDLYSTLSQYASGVATWTGITDRPSIYHIIAKGNSSTYASDRGVWDDTGTLIFQGGRSYNVIVVNRSDLSIISAATYDVYGNATNATSMANALNALTTSKIVIIFTFDEPQLNRLVSSKILQTALLRCGATKTVFGSKNFKRRSAYALIGYPGCKAGNGIEFYSGDIDDDTDAWIDIQVSVKDGNIQLGGGTVKDAADLQYTDGTYVQDLQPADSGATAGATWGTNINNVPSPLQGVTNNTKIDNELAITAMTTLSLFVTGNCVASGHSATKVGGVSAWDSKVWSTQGFTGGAVVSFIAPLSNLCMGLNSDPISGSGYTTIDYCWNTIATGNALWIYENGTGHNIGTFTPGDILAIAYDGMTVKYYQNGVTKRTVSAPKELSLQLDSSFYDPNMTVTGINFAPLTDGSTAVTLSLVSTGNCVAAGHTATKSGGASAFDSKVFSQSSYTGAAHLKFIAAPYNFVMGINQDPWAGSSYETIDASWNCWANGTLYIYESGTGINIGTYSPGDTLEIIYDGKTIKYYQNGTLKRTVNVAKGLTFYLDSSFYDPGALVTGIHFGPLTKVGAVVGDDLTDSSGNTESILNTELIILGAVGNIGEKEYLADTGFSIGTNEDGEVVIGWPDINGTYLLDCAGGNVVVDIEVNCVWTGSAFASSANVAAGIYAGADYNSAVLIKDYTGQIAVGNPAVLQLKDRFVFETNSDTTVLYFQMSGHRGNQSGTHSLYYMITGTYGGKNSFIVHGTKR